jgi:hypothetical protein
VLYDKRDEFAQSVRSASLLVLLAATLLQLIAQLLRTEAWHRSVEAAGATCGRRRLFQAAGIGSLASQLNAQLGTAARIGILRRWDGDGSPRIPALIAAEVPILAVEAGLAAMACFTLVGPLGLPFWSPLPVFAVFGALGWALTRFAHRNVHGPWEGLAVLRSMDGGFAVFVLILFAVFSQIARNYIVLHALGVDASVFDAIAVLILMVMLTQLPIGPSVGAAAVVVILGHNGVAVTAAAGVLLTATGTAGGVLFLLWALADRFGPRLRGRRARQDLRPELLDRAVAREPQREVEVGGEVA